MEQHNIHMKVVLSSVSLETQQKTTQHANNGSLTTTGNATKNIAYTVKKQYNGEATPMRQDLRHWSTNVEATMTNCRSATCCFGTRHNDNPIRIGHRAPGYRGAFIRHMFLWSKKRPRHHKFRRVTHLTANSKRRHVTCQKPKTSMTCCARSVNHPITARVDCAKEHADSV